MEQKIIRCTIIIFLCCHFIPVTVADTIDPISFLCEFFNVTLSALATLVNEFSLDSNITADEISIVQYKDDNSNLSVTLDDEDGINEIELNYDEVIVIIIHGWYSSGYNDWVVNMTQAYHEIGITNTLAVNWNNSADDIDYIASAKSTKRVGELVADWLIKLLEGNDTLIENIHLVGHSLGAHISGFIGKRIKETQDVNISRISGLDVAAPLFEYPIEQNSSNRLDVDDAQEVEAYHTNIGLLGFKKPLAKQDFYINYGGPIQPSCDNPLLAISCSHSYSHTFFTDSIPEDSNYYSRKCSSIYRAKLGICDEHFTAIMGEHNNATDLQGSFFGNTE